MKWFTQENQFKTQRENLSSGKSINLTFQPLTLKKVVTLTQIFPAGYKC